MARVAATAGAVRHPMGRQLADLVPLGAPLLKRLKALGFHTGWDLVSHVPTAYIHSHMGRLVVGQEIALTVICLGLQPRTRGGRLWTYPCRVCVEAVRVDAGDDGIAGGGHLQVPNASGGALRRGAEIVVDLLFFHKPRAPLLPGTRWHVRGVLTRRYQGYAVQHPWMLVPYDQAQRMGITQRAIVPRYQGVGGMPVWHWLRWVQTVFRQWPEVTLHPSAQHDRPAGQESSQGQTASWLHQAPDGADLDGNRVAAILGIPSGAMRASQALMFQGMTLRQALWTAHHPHTLDDTRDGARWRLHMAQSEALAQHLAHQAMDQASDQRLAWACPGPDFQALHLDHNGDTPQSAIEHQVAATSQGGSPLVNTPLALDHLNTRQETCVASDPFSGFLKAFGHPLTPSQQRAWQDIVHDMACVKPMMRLVHGDVGSGKSVLAFLALIQAAAAGYQACLMAPTETLIRQHYRNLTQWLTTIPIQLRLGGRKVLGPKDAPILLGTHALFYDTDTLDRLGLVVIDEQQRFGVLQRLALMERRGDRHGIPHMLCLSATPIPRTFQRTLWGQIDVSLLEGRPTKASMTSYVVNQGRTDALAQWIQTCFDQGQGVYWVCPSIDDEDEGVKAQYAFWNTRFPGKVGLLHGRMKSEEKDAILDRFRRKDIGLLVSTTVIEVGVHVDHASTMMIQDSPHFGMAQLHQLRGRVGRSTVAGHCFFLYEPPLAEPARQRLAFMRTCTDGFAVAEKDWALRGAGVILGTQQSGLAAYRFFCPVRHQSWTPAIIQHAAHLCAHFPAAARTVMDLFGYALPDILSAG